MSRSVRYQDPAICEHLASQYVAGVMTPLVRARTEKLINQTPALEKAVASWASRFSTLQDQLPVKVASKELWDKIDQTIAQTDGRPASALEQFSDKKHWWHNLFLWRITGIAGMATSFALAMLFVFLPAPKSIDLLAEAPVESPPTEVGVSGAPSYMAAMSRHTSADKTEDIIRFVINAYAKTESSPSRLFVQWSKRHPRAAQQGMHIWAEDLETGALTYIGTEPETGGALALDKTTWAAVSNSGRLIMTEDANTPTASNTLFSGPCVQLTHWQQSVKLG